MLKEKNLKDYVFKQNKFNLCLEGNDFNYEKNYKNFKSNDVNNNIINSNFTSCK